MGAEDRKSITALVTSGGSINIVTRMPYAEIEKELFESNSEWVTILGIDGPAEDVVSIRFLRSSFYGAIYGKHHPPIRQAQPMPRGVIQ